jgi:hypothetical protein
MRKGTIKMIDELKNFEGFSKMANKFEKLRNDRNTHYLNQPATNFIYLPKNQNTLTSSLINLNNEIKQTMVKKQPKNVSIYSNNIVKIDNTENLKSKKYQNLNNAKDLQVISDNTTKGVSSFAEMEFANQNETTNLSKTHQHKYDHVDYNYEIIEEQKPLIHPDVYKKIMKSSMFNPKISNRSYNLSDIEHEEEQREKIGKKVPQIKVKLNQEKPIKSENSNKEPGVKVMSGREKKIPFDTHTNTKEHNPIQKQTTKLQTQESMEDTKDKKNDNEQNLEKKMLLLKTPEKKNNDIEKNPEEENKIKNSNCLEDLYADQSDKNSESKSKHLNGHLTKRSEPYDNFKDKNCYSIESEKNDPRPNKINKKKDSIYKGKHITLKSNHQHSPLHIKYST